MATNPAPELVTQPNALPTNKVVAYTLGAILSAVAMRVVENYTGFGFTHDPLVNQGLPLIFGSLVAYFVKDNANV